MKKKPKAALMAFLLYVGCNAFIFVSIPIFRWLLSSKIAHWLEIDKPTKAYVPGFFYAYQILLLMIAFCYYLERVKRD